MNIISIVSANLRRLREQQRLSISELERRSGVGKATISSLEGGKGNPTVETLWALAKALNVPFGALVSEPSERKDVVRSDEGVKISGMAGYTRLVDRLSRDGCIEIYEMVLVPGEERVADPHPEGVLEHLLVVQGRVRTGPTEAPVLLGTGDYLTFHGDLQHSYSALDTEARVIVWIEYPSRSMEEREEHVSTPCSIADCEDFLVREDADIRCVVRNHLERCWMDLIHGLNMKRLQFSVENSRVKMELEHIIEQEIQSSGYRRWVQSFAVQDGERCLTVLSFPKAPFQRTVPLRTRQWLSVQDFRSMSVPEKAEYLLALGDYELAPEDIGALRVLLNDPAPSIRALVSDLLTQLGYPTMPRDFSIHGFSMVRPGSARKWVALASMIRKHVACDERSTVLCLGAGMDSSVGLRMVSDLNPHLEMCTVRANAVDSKYRKSNGARHGGEMVENVDFLDITVDRTFPFMISVDALHHINAYLLLKKSSKILDERGKLFFVDDLISRFSTSKERERNLILHHTSYMLAAMVPISKESQDHLRPEERRLVQALQQNVPLIAAEAYEGQLDSAIRRCRDLLSATEGLQMSPVVSNDVVAFYRRQVLELRALVARLDDATAHVTFPERFMQLARMAGFEVSEHERVYPTVGDSDLDAGTHLFCLTKLT